MPELDNLLTAFIEMRTTELTINLVLNKQRKNRNGETPIYLRLMFHGERKLIQTGVTIPEGQWDAKSQSIRSTHPNFSELNRKLSDIKRKYTDIRDGFIKRGIDYSVSDVVNGDKVKSGTSTVLVDVLESMIRHKGLSHNTAMAYRASVRRLGEAGVLKLGDISPDGVQGLCKRLKSNELSDSSVNVTMACLGSLWKYGVDLGICEGYLFSRFRHWKKYRIAENKVSLTDGEITSMLNDFVSRSVVADGIQGVWAYTDEAYFQLMNRNSELFAECCFLLSYQLQGLAFADLVRIKSENISMVEIDGVEYYCVSGLKRKKTNKLIKDMFIVKDEDTCVLFECFMRTMDLREGYFLPVLQNNELAYHYNGDEKKISEACGSCSVVVNKGLRSVFKRLGITEDATFYSARHSFATNYILNGGNPIYLADLMGRSVNNIFRYVTGLTSYQQNINERNRVFGKSK